MENPYWTPSIAEKQKNEKQNKKTKKRKIMNVFPTYVQSLLFVEMLGVEQQERYSGDKGVSLRPEGTVCITREK